MCTLLAPFLYPIARRESNPRYPPFELLRVHSALGKTLPNVQWGQYRESAALNEVTAYDSLSLSFYPSVFLSPYPFFSLSLSLFLPLSYSWPPGFRTAWARRPLVRGTAMEELGGGRWLIWARNCPTKSNFISPEACLDNRAAKWPAANLTISSTNFAGDYFTRCSLVRPRGRA